MRKNGFTLIELLAVIVILGLLVTLITPNLMSLLDDKQDVLYENTISELKSVAASYMASNIDKYSEITSNGYTYVTIETLCNEKYISCPINNPKDNSNIEGKIKITYENDKYVYEYID